MKKILNIEIGARVRAARTRLNLSREQLAEFVGISTLFVGYIECGQKGMSTETLIALCKALNVSADYILLGKDPGAKADNEAKVILEHFDPEHLPLAAESLRHTIHTINLVRATEKDLGDERKKTATQKSISADLHVAARSGGKAYKKLDQNTDAQVQLELQRIKKQKKSPNS